MDTNGTEELSHHLEKFIQEKEREEDPRDNEISFGPGHSVFRPPLLSQAMVAQDLRIPNIPFIFWATIWIPLPASLSNAMDAMFKALDDFLTKMKDVDQHFTVFPHNLSHYGILTSLPKLIDNPEDLPLEVNKWLIYFPQAKPRFQDGDVYTMVLISCSSPLSKIMKENGDWFWETRFGMWEVDIQTEAPISIGWLHFSTNTTNMMVLKREISKFINDILVGLCWKMISLSMQGKIAKENQVWALHVYVDELDVTEAKPRLMVLYKGNASLDHHFLLHIQMLLVPEIDAVLNTQGQCKIDKLHTSQVT